MNKAELIDAIAGGANLTKADAKKALDAFITSTTDSLKKGDRVALVGFGNEPFSSMVTPSITSIEQHSEEIGKQAAYVFLEHIKKDVVKQTLTKKILDVDLLVRDSSNKKK